MEADELYAWLCAGERRKQLVARLKQPSTAKHIDRWLEVGLDSCSYVLWELSVYGLVRCLNRHARRSRVYWLTPLGKSCQRRVRDNMGLPRLRHGYPVVDWYLYGWTCFSHRAAVVRALDRPLQPAAIKRRAKSRDSSLRMSANNVRDVMRLMLARQVVRVAKNGGRGHPKYELTKIGRDLRALLEEAGSPG